MKKRLIAFLFVIALCLSTVLPVCATETSGFVNEYNRVVDMADLLTDQEEAALIKKLDAISLRHNMDVVLVTTNDLEGFSVQEYAHLLYAQCQFGYGADKDGTMLLISMEDSDWYLYTHGYGTTAFTNDGIEYIGTQITEYLSDGDFVAAFTRYAELCDGFIAQAKSGTPYDKSTLPREPLSFAWIPASLVIGFLVAKIIVGNMKGELKTVHTQAAANSYMVKGSMNITDSRDLFLYHTVTKTEKAKNDSSSGSTHQSESGSIHGGGGGKF